MYSPGFSISHGKLGIIVTLFLKYGADLYRACPPPGHCLWRHREVWLEWHGRVSPLPSAFPITYTQLLK